MHFVAALLLWGWVAATAGPQAEEAYRLVHQAYQLQTAQPPNLDRAYELYSQALRLEPELFDALYNAGLILYQRKHFSQAKNLLGKAVRSARTHHADKPELEAEASNALGVCFQKEGRVPDAIKWFRAALQKDPGYVKAHFNLINGYLAERDIEKAAAALKRAQEQAPSPQYNQLKGKLKAKESWQAWSPLWVKVIVAGLVGGMVVYAVMRKMKKPAA